MEQRSEWLEITPLDGDDQVSFGRRRRIRWPNPRGRRFKLVGALVALAVVSGGVTAVVIATRAPNAPAPQAITAAAASCSAEPTRMAPENGLDQRYTATVQFDNRGFLGLTYSVMATWYLQDIVVASRTIRTNVPAQGSARAVIHVRVPGDRSQPILSLKDTARCSTHVQLLHTFGEGFH